MNTELFRKIEEKIEADPEALNMAVWETACGTTYCLAGWAIHLTTGAPIYNQHDRQVPRHEYSSETKALAASLGLRLFGVEDIAARLLGLEGVDAHMFYTDEATARVFIRFAARGCPVSGRAAWYIAREGAE